MPFFFLFKQKTAYEMRISDWSSDVCSSDLYDVQEIEQFRVLRGLAYHAVRQQDPRLIGRVATASARISQHHLAKPRFEAVVGLAEAHGACGVQVAHSGTLMGVLFDADERGVASRTAALAGTLGQARFRGIRTFAVNVDGAFLR